MLDWVGGWANLLGTLRSASIFSKLLYPDIPQVLRWKWALWVPWSGGPAVSRMLLVANDSDGCVRVQDSPRAWLHHVLDDCCPLFQLTWAFVRSLYFFWGASFRDIFFLFSFRRGVNYPLAASSPLWASHGPRPGLSNANWWARCEYLSAPLARHTGEVLILQQAWRFLAFFRGAGHCHLAASSQLMHLLPVWCLPLPVAFS